MLRFWIMNWQLEVTGEVTAGCLAWLTRSRLVAVLIDENHVAGPAGEPVSGPVTRPPQDEPRYQGTLHKISVAPCMLWSDLAMFAKLVKSPRRRSRVLFMNGSYRPTDDITA